MTPKNRLVFLSLSLLMCGLTGCDQFRDKVASTLSPKTADQINAEASTALDARQPAKALELTKPLLANPKVAPPAVLMTAARAHAALGEVSETIQLLQILVDTRIAQKQDLLTDEAFSSIRTDVRFLSWVANVSNTSNSMSPTSADSDQSPLSVQSGPSVSAEIKAGSVSATAGSVSVKISN